MQKKILSLVFVFFFISLGAFLDASLYLRDNLKKAKAGDFIVTMQGKTYSLLHIDATTDQTMTIEEITVPVHKICRSQFSWRNWVEQGAPGNTSWVRYTIDLHTAEMKDYFSFTKNQWFEPPKQNNFLSTLLNLQLEYIPLVQRRKIGVSIRSAARDKRPIWQPQMIVDGRIVDCVTFDAWKTCWPKDGTDLSGRTIEVYTPRENGAYSSYFPYWLQISGVVGNAKIRIVDSGQGMPSRQK